MKLLVLFIWVLLIPIRRSFSIEYVSEEIGKKQDVIVSFNDNIMIAAFNSKKVYIFYLISNHESRNFSYEIPYPHEDIRIYGISVLKMQNNRTATFIQVTKNETSNTIILTRININLDYLNRCNKYLTEKHTNLFSNKTDQKYILLKVDPDEKYAYVTGSSFIFSFDLLSYRIIEKYEVTHVGCGGHNGSLIPYAFDIKHNLMVVGGFHEIYNSYRRKSCIYIFTLQPIAFIEARIINEDDLTNSEINDFFQDSLTLVSIDPSSTTIAIGQPRLNMVTVIFLGRNISAIWISHTIQMSEDSNSVQFGRSVAWLNDKGMLAILVGNSGNRTGLESEIQVYQNISRNTTNGFIAPDYTLPNHQQTLHKIDYQPGSRKRSLRFFLMRANLLLMFRNDNKFIFIPIAKPGFCSREPLSIFESKFSVFSVSEMCMLSTRMKPVIRPQPSSNRALITGYVLQSKPCVSGTYRIGSSFGPCKVCPSGTKNPGNNLSIICQHCRNESFCPLGASDDINIDDFRSYSQAFSYPDSPIIDNYDDLLLLNFIPNKWSLGCVLSSPLLLTFIFTSIAFLIWLIMLYIKKRRSHKFNIHRQKAKCIFKRIDLIAEGEKFVGGLATVVVFAITIYSIIYAFIYFQSYYSENKDGIRQSCEDNQQNTQFESTLQLPLPDHHGNYWDIFKLLDEQAFNMTVSLINTRALCENIKIKHNKLRGKLESIEGMMCHNSSHHGVTSFSFHVPTHTSTVEVIIDGSYFLGALRLCLYGSSNTTMYDGVNNTVHELDTCTRFYTDNETLGRSTDFNVHLVKIINITNPLRRFEKHKFDGRWAPIIKNIDDLAEDVYYVKHGEYQRYGSDETTFTVTFKEENYFVQNNKSPIIRRGAIIFHTVMFIFLCLDTVGMVFLLYKLWGQPLLKRICPSFDDAHDNCTSVDLLQIKNDPALQCKLKPTSNDIYHDEDLGRKSIIQSPLISGNVAAAHLKARNSDEYDKMQINMFADQHERLIKEVCDIKTQMQQIIQENTYLKHRLNGIYQSQQCSN